MAGSGWTHARRRAGCYQCGAKALPKKRSVYVYMYSLAHLCTRFLRAFLRRALASSLIRANSLLFLSLRCFARTVQYCSHKDNTFIMRASSYDAKNRLSIVACRVVTCQRRIMMSVIMPIIRSTFVRSMRIEPFLAKAHSKAVQCAL